MKKNKYRKKPVTIEAVELGYDNANQVAAWCGGTVGSIEGTYMYRPVFIITLEGTMRADVGDFVIKGVNGEFYPCKPDIFYASYDAVDDDDIEPPAMKIKWTTESPREAGFYWVELHSSSVRCIIDVDIDDDGFAYWSMHGDCGDYDTESGHWEEYIEKRSVDPIEVPE